ncbi:MAG: hypothetical protein ACPGAO_00700 [Flavobacteriaceae bacterium]
MIVFYKTIPFTSIQSEEEDFYIVYFENGQIIKCNAYLIGILTFCLVQKSIYHIDTFIAESLPSFNEKQRKKIFNDLLSLKIIQRADKFLISKRNKIEPGYLKNNFTLITEKQVKRITSRFLFLFRREVVCLILVTLMIQMSYHYWNSIVFIDETVHIKTIILVTALSVFFHEIGHATACQFYGKKVSKIGGGFYLFRPVMFADVSQIWSLNRMKRIKVSLSGIYFELVFVVFLFTLQLTFNTDIFLFLGYLLMTQSLWNLNPLIRSDGYWIVTDSLGVLNLNKEGRIIWLDLLQRTKKLKVKEWGVAIYFFIFKCGTLILTLIYLSHFYKPVKDLFYSILQTNGRNYINRLNTLEYKEVLGVLIFCFLLFRIVHALCIVGAYFSRKLKYIIYGQKTEVK